MKDFLIRSRLRPGDVGSIIRQHGIVHASEHGFDATFEAYVAGPLAKLVCHASDRERAWIAEQDGEWAGSIAIAEADSQIARLRWFLVDTSSGLATVRHHHFRGSFLSECGCHRCQIQPGYNDAVWGTWPTTQNLVASACKQEGSNR